MMLARKQGPWGCGAMPRIWPLLTLLALVLPLVTASQIEAATKCDSACRDCRKSCASQKLDCLTHARADRTSALGDCTPGRSGRSCRRLARQMLMRAWSECRQSATACRSCCRANGSDGCVTTTTVITPTTTTLTFGTTTSSTLPAVFVVLMENQDWSNIRGNASAPYINDTLLPMASHAEQYYNPPGNHPSEPNYLWLEAGTNFGIRDDNPPASNHQRTTRHLVSLLNAAGVSWKAYQEDISGTTCPLTNRGSYAVKHNPFVFFDDVTGSNNPADAYCIAHVRPYSEL